MGCRRTMLTLCTQACNCQMPFLLCTDPCLLACAAGRQAQASNKMQDMCNLFAVYEELQGSRWREGWVRHPAHGKSAYAEV